MSSKTEMKKKAKKSEMQEDDKRKMFFPFVTIRLGNSGNIGKGLSKRKS